MRYLLLLLALLCAAPAHAEALNWQNFATQPILENGRLKPLDSFARQTLQRFSGSDHLGSEPAISWLAGVLFNPGQAATPRCFAVANAHVRAALKLAPREDKLYTLAELASGLGQTAESAEALSRKKPADLTPDEQALLALHTNVLLYNQLLQSFSLLLPLPVEAPEEWEHRLPHHASYLEALKIEPELIAELRHVLTPETTEHPEKLTPAEQQLATFAMTLQQLRKGGESNSTLRVLPAQWEAAKGEWLAPWALLLSGQAGPESAPLLHDWREAAKAYRMGDAQAWNTATQNLRARTLAAQPDAALGTRLKVEEVYQTTKPYVVISALFALAALLALGSFKKGRAFAAWALFAVATLGLAAALGTRIYILARPPVGTLYESVLFVTLVIALAALFTTWRSRAPALLIGAALICIGLLTAAPALISESEGLTMLSAVLNTNLWLTVHVLCITAGYGACLITSLLAHGLLLRPQHAMGQALMHKLGLIALLLTATGTLLGGVWADQSWGRFWGWDPKENGALIIVLWLLWLQHGKLAGRVGPRAYQAGLAALAVVVAQAWFGVNLLSVGLHSYGFITGIATALFSFTALDLALIALMWARARKL